MQSVDFLRAFIGSILQGMDFGEGKAVLLFYTGTFYRFHDGVYIPGQEPTDSDPVRSLGDLLDPLLGGHQIDYVACVLRPLGVSLRATGTKSGPSYRV